MSTLNCGIILYGRTVSRDYDWLIGSPLLSKRDHTQLKRVFDVLGNKKEMLAEMSVKPIFCVRFPNTMVVVSFGISEFVDMQARPIRYLQGYYSSSSRGFSTSELKSILAVLKSDKKVWDSGSIGGFKALTSLVQHSVPIQGEAELELVDAAPSNEVTQDDEASTINASFNDAGYAILVDKLGTEVVTFAFGAVPEIALDFNAYGHFDLIAPISFYATREGRATVEIGKSLSLKGIRKLGKSHCSIKLEYSGRVIHSLKSDLDSKDSGQHGGTYSDGAGIGNLLNSSRELADLYDVFATETARKFDWFMSSDPSIFRSAEKRL